MHIGLKGSVSGQTYELSTKKWHGENDEFFDLFFEPKLDISRLKQRPPDLWRYREAIPLEIKAETVAFGEGFTPLLEVDFGTGFKPLIKQEQLFSTGSYKDRGSAVMMSHIKQLQVKHVVQDSSGNAGASVAAYAARAGIACDIYLPADTSEAKILQMEAHGATIVKVPGNRQAAADAAFEAARHSYYASHCYSPFFFHGTKTFAYEVCEQLGWKAPDAVVLPAGNGTLLLGCAIGFKELARMGVITKMPKLIAVQAALCNPLHRLFHRVGSDQDPLTGVTLAEGIAIAKPVRLQQMLEAVKSSSGTVISVSEEQVISAWKMMAGKGFFIEPTAAAAIAGLQLYSQSVQTIGTLVSLFSGHGLKSTEKIAKMLH